MTVGADAARSTEKILRLCRKKGIRVMFLTIPMYHAHIAHPEALHANLAPVIGNTPWLDLQDPAYDEVFGPECFENTYKENQHQTSTGAYRTSLLLARFIETNHY